MFVFPPVSYVEILTSKGNGLCSWGLWGVFKSGGWTLQRAPFSPCPPCEDTSVWPRSEPLPEHADTLASAFEPPELWEVRFCVYKPPVCGICWGSLNRLRQMLLLLFRNPGVTSGGVWLLSLYFLFESLDPSQRPLKRLLWLLCQEWSEGFRSRSGEIQSWGSSVDDVKLGRWC